MSDVVWSDYSRLHKEACDLRARVAELEAENAGIWDALLPFQCTGCGSTETIEQIRAKHPGALSCCPERDMKPRAARLEALLIEVVHCGGQCPPELIAKIERETPEAGWTDVKEVMPNSPAPGPQHDARPRPAQSPAGAVCDHGIPLNGACLKCAEWDE